MPFALPYAAGLVTWRSGLSKSVLPYGTWSSPITADLILADAAFDRLPKVVVDGDDVYWEEKRAEEKGRSTIVRLRGDDRASVVPAPFDARTRVHTYGGGAFCAAAGTLYFSNFADGRVYRVADGEEPVALTPDDGRRYADLQLANGRVFAVCEDHRAEGEPPASIVAFDAAAPSEPEVLVEGRDFFGGLALSRDGTKLAYVAWDHPNMPWDATSLYVLDLESGATQDVGTAPDVSYADPSWAHDGTLHYVSDATGFWNLYRGDERIGPSDAELTRPAWVFGGRCHAHLADGTILAAYCRRGTWRLTHIGADEVDLPYSEIFSVAASDRRCVISAGAPDRPSAIVDVTDGVKVLREGQRLDLDAGYLSTPELIEYESGGGSSFVFFYPPANRDVVAPDDERPPLIVLGHGGPTSSAGTRLDLSGVQYWTSRGFAVAKVDYRGSTGYGTAFRRALDGGWGDFDVEDCVNAARHLATVGYVDGDRMAIIGGSAGGLTVLAALAFHDVFRAGVSYYGVSDLELLAAETHKFEARYMDRLIGPLDTHLEVYRGRSPIHRVGQIQAPILFFQGDEDVIVPPNQSERMIDALRARGVACAYEKFAGEGHGFTQASTKRRCLDAQHDFLARVFGFAPPPGVDAVDLRSH
ncbi:MAG: prolyl oligopeptidase family serine peptidase [Deltaproteobacteria bacterium]